MITPKLLKRHAAGNPIKVGWVGAGRMITGAICQTALMKGMRNAVICDIRPEAAIRAYEINGVTKTGHRVHRNTSARSTTRSGPGSR